MTVLKTDTFFDKGDQMPAINYNLIQMGIEDPTWKTVAISASEYVDMPRDRLYQRWSDMERWPQWAPYIQSAKWVSKAGGDGWVPLSIFEEKTRLALIGTRTETVNITNIIAKENIIAVQWCGNETIKYCHSWIFERINENRTRIMNTEIIDDGSVGIIKPLVYKRWQGMFKEAIDDLIAAENITG